MLLTWRAASKFCSTVQSNQSLQEDLKCFGSSINFFSHHPKDIFSRSRSRIRWFQLFWMFSGCRCIRDNIGRFWTWPSQSQKHAVQGGFQDLQTKTIQSTSINSFLRKEEEQWHQQSSYPLPHINYHPDYNPPRPFPRLPPSRKAYHIFPFLCPAYFCVLFWFFFCFCTRADSNPPFVNATSPSKTHPTSSSIPQFSNFYRRPSPPREELIPEKRYMALHFFGIWKLFL